MLHSRFAQVLTFPLVAFGLFVANPFVLYFTGLYRLTLEYAVLHELIHAHFDRGRLPVLLAADRPRPAARPLAATRPRALLMVLSMPFHTVLGLTIMQSSDLLGGDWYPSLHLTWADPFDDQKVAGGILWAGGEFVSVTMLARAGRAVDARVRAGGPADRPRAGPARRPLRRSGGSVRSGPRDGTRRPD